VTGLARLSRRAVEDATVEIVLDGSTERELRLTQVGEVYAKWLSDNWGARSRHRGEERSCTLHAMLLIALYRSKQKGQQVFLDPEPECH
jgi:hypothetical protein